METNITAQDYLEYLSKIRPRDYQEAFEISHQKANLVATILYLEECLDANYEKP